MDINKDMTKLIIGIVGRDSGSWVVTMDKLLIGYVVAVDVLGSVHVVPLEDALDNIKMHRKAKSVEIHSVADFGRQRMG